MNKVTYLSLKSDFVKGVWTGIQSFACLGFLERERSVGNKYILVAVDYVSKWVEAMATSRNDAKTVVKFIKKNIFFSIWGTSNID